MVTHIQLHRSSVAGATPDVSGMLEGEPAVNLNDKKMYVKGADGSLITLVDGPVSAAGSVNDIQFKDPAGFCGDSQFVFDPTTQRLGIGTNNPQEGIHVHGNVNSSYGFSGATGLLTTSLGVGTKTPREMVEVHGTILTQGISADGGTFEGNVVIHDAGDVSLTIKGDTDNSGENDNPLIRLEQDGGVVSFNVGINGDANNQFTGALANAFYIEGDSVANANQDIQLATGNANRLTIEGDTGKVGIGTNIPRAQLEIGGSTLAGAPAATVLAAGFSADGATFSGASFGAVTISGLVNSAYALPAADGSAGQVMMTDGSDAVSFQTIKFTANFVLDSDVPLVTGSRDKALYKIPYDNAVITEVILRSEDAAASSDTTSLVVALEAIQRSNLLNNADPATHSTIMSATLNDSTDDHSDINTGLTHAVGSDNSIRYLRINVTDNSGNHTHCQVMVLMEARTT